MKKLMVMMAAGASALALSADTWFSDAVTAYPEGWTNTSGSEMSEGVISFDADAASPLTYTASEKDLADGAAQIQYQVGMKFTPFAELPSLDDYANAKAGICVCNGAYYGIAYDANGGKNDWFQLSGTPGDSAVNVTVTVAPNDSDSSLLDLSYAIGDDVTSGLILDAYRGTSFQSASVSGSGELSTLTGTYEAAAPTEFEITFTDGDAWTHISQVGAGEMPEAPTGEVPSRTGYTFAGWTPALAPATAEVTYTAVYEPNLYTVTFSTNNTEVASTNIPYGTTLAAGDIPALFGGLEGNWYVDPLGAIIGSDTNFNFTVAAELPPIPDVIKSGSAAQETAYRAWAATVGETGKTADVLADAFALDVTPAEIAAADGDVEEAASEKLATEITAEMVAALAAGTDPDFSALETKYPNAEFEFVEEDDIDAVEGKSGFYRLKASFKPAN